MTNQIDYRDPTPNNFPEDYDPTKVDPRVKLRSDSIKHKQKGKHTREAMYQALEIGAVTAGEAKTTADKTAESQDNLNQRVDDQISAGTIKDEEIDFRHSDMLKKTFETMRKRGDFYDNEFADRGVNVKWFGAKADAETNDIEAVKLAVAYADSIGGGTVFFPSGEYNVSGIVELKNNVNFKFSPNTDIYRATGLIFWSRSTGTGYGAGANNVIFDGGSFHAGLKGEPYKPKAGIAVGFALNHAANITIKNAHFRYCTNPGHTIDLGGCDNVLVDNCVFEGSTTLKDYWYDEAIQVDNSTAGGETYNDPNNSSVGYDGISSKNITVNNCRFVPSYSSDGTIETHAPKAFGTHSTVGEVVAAQNLTFSNNYVKDAGPSTSKRLGGWVHFVSGNNIRIYGNHFEQTNYDDSMIISFYLDGAFVDPAKAGVLPMQWDSLVPPTRDYENILVANNTFVNIKGNTSGIIHFDRPSITTGRDYGSVVISDNQLIGCYDDTIDSTQDPNSGSVFAFAFYISNLKLTRNQIDTIKRIGIVTACGVVSANDNVCERSNTGGFSFTDVETLVCNNNTISSVTGTPFGFMRVTNFSVIGNNVAVTARNQYEPYFISSNGSMVGNISANIFNAEKLATAMIAAINIVGVPARNSMNIGNNQYSNAAKFVNSTSATAVIHESNNNLFYTR